MLEVWDMPAEDKIIVQLDEMGQPIGDEGKTLTNFIGTKNLSLSLSLKQSDYSNLLKENKLSCMV
uniref:Uncharacterized protein n=1 Tax=Nelumbo nucifera TaxID=4432 RepID=A0A822XVH9_NELNU|nr:TPA_asm: hypothetical protein HUJ06_024634 [Nelumbo nucifera]